MIEVENRKCICGEKATIIIVINGTKTYRCNECKKYYRLFRKIMDAKQMTEHEIKLLKIKKFLKLKDTDNKTLETVKKIIEDGTCKK